MTTRSMKEKREKIVKETIQHYEQNPRAVSEELSTDEPYYSLCLYQINDDTMCAFGRCMTKEALEEAIEFDFNDSSIKALTEGVGKGENEQEMLDSLLKPEYRGHCMGFWEAIQHLHDQDKYWYDYDNDYRGFTQKGQEWADRICSNDSYESVPPTYEDFLIREEKEGAV